MNRMRSLIVGLAIVSLLAVGIVAVAGNEFGRSATWKGSQAGDCSLYERDADGDGILNSDDPDWTRPLDGSGYGSRRGGGMGQGARRGLCTGSCS